MKWMIASDLHGSERACREMLAAFRREAPDGSFIIVYVGNDEAPFELELTWLRDHPQAYDIGEEEFHLAFRADDFAAAHAKHAEMGCICFENTKMGIYFIQDPDGYWLEILPPRN